MQSGSTPKVEDHYKDVQDPNYDAMQLQLQQLVQQGVITPEDAKAVNVDPSAMNNISLDPKLKAAQMAALSGLQDVSNNGGMTLADKANLSHIATDEAVQSKGARDAILSNAQSRGLGGSGLELMSQLQNEQASAGRKSQRDLDVAGQAQARALDALMKGGSLAGDINNQDFNQQAQAAAANDAISKFNATNQQNVGLTNTGAHNAAQAANLSAKQGVADANVNLGNSQQQYNKGLEQTKFNNAIAKAGGQQNAANTNAQIEGQNSQNAANAFNNTIGTAASLGAAAMTGGGSLAAQAAIKAAAANKKEGGLVMGDPSDQDTMPHMLQPGEMVVRKEDVPDMLKKKHSNESGDFDVAAFLDDVTGHKYGYSKGRKKNG